MSGNALPRKTDEIHLGPLTSALDSEPGLAALWLGYWIEPTLYERDR